MSVEPGVHTALRSHANQDRGELNPLIPMRSPREGPRE